VNWSSWLLWGFIATLVETTISVASQSLGLTRMNLPYLLGTVFTPNREKAKFYGLLSHLFFGWVFSLIYVLIFESLGMAGWWRGAIIGIVHALFVLMAMMAVIPGVHPRMASEQHGPSAHKLLEPPGFMAMHYGVNTPIAVLASHAVFGALLGAFYQLK
jgi:uncharacterized membrane protein (DUF485 family)